MPSNGYRSIVTSIDFHEKNLPDCLREMAKWVDEHNKISENIINVDIQDDSEYGDWYGTFYCDGDLTK